MSVKTNLVYAEYRWKIAKGKPSVAALYLRVRVEACAARSWGKLLVLMHTDAEVGGSG